MECKNCGHTFEGKFCNACGQNTSVDRLTLKSFIVELSESIFQVDRGFFFTIKGLLTRPGHSIRAYLSGQRKYYFKPIAFVLLLATFYFIITKIIGSNTLLADGIVGFRRGIESTTNPSQNTVVFELLTTWLIDNFAYTTLLLMPLISIATFIAFLGKGQNYLEHIVINSYLMGLQTIFYVLFTIVDYVINQNDFTVLLAFILSVSYRFWTFFQFYHTDKKRYTALRLVLVYALLYFLIAIGLGFLFLIVKIFI
ncbi:DUF3667 domain-containing protein [Winogradskyella sp.]|uniref:DUF3667 domain-containing protein n=1 Tax=Winogradskyella sp. TaxID=1883156 RepID=UPI003BAD62B2